MISYKVNSFIVNNIEEVNQKLDDDYLSSDAIINIQPISGNRLKVFYHKPKDWSVINCFIELPEWVKKKYEVTN